MRAMWTLVVLSTMVAASGCKSEELPDNGWDYECQCSGQDLVLSEAGESGCSTTDHENWSRDEPDLEREAETWEEFCCDGDDCSCDCVIVSEPGDGWSNHQ